MEESAAKVVSQIPPTAVNHRGEPRPGHPFVSSDPQFLALQEAAQQARSPELARLVRHGVGFHSAGLCPEDRALVEGLFLQRHVQARSGARSGGGHGGGGGRRRPSRRAPLLQLSPAQPSWLRLLLFFLLLTSAALTTPPALSSPARPPQVLCTTSTLAQGVNLPCHLVVIKGTRLYDKGGYREYSRSAVLQMIGRAGRRQFDEFGVAVIMTGAPRPAAPPAAAPLALWLPLRRSRSPMAGRSAW